MASRADTQTTEATEDPSLIPRLERVQKFYEEYNRITHNVLGAASKEESEGLMQWVNSATATHESIADLERYQSTYQAMLRSAEKLKTDFMAKLDAARSKPIPLLSKESYNDWEARFRKALYKEKESFITSKLPEFINSWQTLIDKRSELLKNPKVKSLTTKDVEDLNDFLNDKRFGELSNKKRIGLVAMVKAAMKAKEREIPELYAQAKSMLESAARQKALSWDKVGVWLDRIFKTGAKNELIADFISGSGSTIAGKKMNLSTLIANWAEASAHFEKIEDKRKKAGTPPGFHFVSMSVFLNWRYEQRTSYLQEAEYRFTDIDKEPGLFLRIRHELGAKDWEAAEELIARARKGENQWGKENEDKLQSMERFLREHRSKESTEKKSEVKPDPKALRAEMNSLMRQLPPRLRSTYVKSLNRGYQAFWAMTTLMYNRVWCHTHNMLDPEKEKNLEQTAKEKTRERLEHGHQKVGWEANDIRGSDTNTRGAVRDQAGVRGAQTIFTNETSDETLVDEIDEQKNDRNFWYWTSMIPEGVPYEQHQHVVMNINPQMKKVARKMQELGMNYSLADADADLVQPDHIVQARG